MSVSRTGFLPFRFWAWAWFVAWLLLLGQAPAAHLAGLPAGVFFVVAAAGYAALYLLPLLLAPLLGRLAARMVGAGAGRLLSGAWLTLWSAFVQLVLVVDLLVFRQFGFHLNGFVWNLVSTPGGVESMGAGTATWATALGVAVPTLAANAGLLWLCRRQAGAHARAGRWLRPALAALLVCAVGERLAYGVSHFTGRADVLAAAGALPFYQPTTFRHLAQSLGFTPASRQPDKLRAAGGSFVYPLAPLRLEPPSRLPNIVWLVAESLRADALDAGIMPATSAFADQALRFDRHYSSGNGTRMGMFGMFYGLYGKDWFPVLEGGRPPVLLDALRQLDYRIEAWSSARFSYPEFDRTIFAGLPHSALHDGAQGEGWQRDRINVGQMLEFVRDAAQAPDRRPFMSFMFFESPHARYYFPPENAIRKPYLETFNYATVSLTRDIELIRNRYLNACNHLDSQFARVFDEIERLGLQDDTIVIVTGDHGEEFMEKGRWGHNSSFVEEQIRVPLVLRVPGVAPRRVAAMSSHLDLPATLLSRLGVRNAPHELSLGHDLLGRRQRQSTVISDWSSVAWVAAAYKAVYPLASAGFANAGTFTPDDRAVADADAVRAAHREDLAQLLDGLSRFHRRAVR